MGLVMFRGLGNTNTQRLVAPSLQDTSSASAADGDPQQRRERSNELLRTAVIWGPGPCRWRRQIEALVCAGLP